MVIWGVCFVEWVWLGFDVWLRWHSVCELYSTDDTHANTYAGLTYILKPHLIQTLAIDRKYHLLMCRSSKIKYFISSVPTKMWFVVVGGLLRIICFI